MRSFSYTRLYVLCTVFLIIFYFYWTGRGSLPESPQTVTEKQVLPTKKHYVTRHIITVAVVCCGERLHEALTMIKSAIMLSKVKLRFIVLAEDALILNFEEKLSEWQELTNNGFTYQVMPVNFPIEDGAQWRKMFKPCASQRLFLPNLLKDIDSILYVDSDTLFLTPVEEIWEHFYSMNSSQMAALAPEHEDPNAGWYNRFAKHPYYGEFGVNSGVMLMNLTRMREFQWVDYVIPIYKKYKLKIIWGDQDIINIIFHFHPDKLYIYPCRYNYRPDHCMYMSVCKSAERQGVAVIHGSRGIFHVEKQPVFRAIYRAYEEFQLSGDIYQDFYNPLEGYLDHTTETNCGHIIGIYLKNLRKHIDIKEDNS